MMSSSLNAYLVLIIEKKKKRERRKVKSSFLASMPISTSKKMEYPPHWEHMPSFVSNNGISMVFILKAFKN